MCKKIIKILMTAAVVSLVLLVQNVRAENDKDPHKTIECDACHKGDVSFGKIPDELEFVQEDIVCVCLTCHEKIINVHHPQRVQVTNDIPDYLPLGEGNSITCRTCHIIHQKDEATHLLRSAGIGNYTNRLDICYDCHSSDFKKITPHKSEKEGISCLICHRDAPTIKDTDKTVTLITEDVEMMCNFCHNIEEENHPLNVDKNTRLPAGLPLSKDKKHVCTTCHDPHGTTGTINFLREKYVIALEFGKYENPHNEREYFNCMKCHPDIPQVEKYVNCRYKDDFILLCYNCHGADAEKCHPVNIKLKEGMKPPEGFELDANGLISCVTCHDPDCSGGKKIRYRNLNGIYSSSCQDCHDFSEEVINDPHTGKDEVTQDCYYCHNKTESMNDFGMSEKFVCLKCHKFKDHPLRTDLNMSGLIMAKSIPFIKLDKKCKITCSTCHDPHEKSTKDYKLRVIEDMTVCEACHQA